MGRRERERPVLFPMPGKVRPETRAVPDLLMRKVGGEGDRISVEIQDERNRNFAAQIRQPEAEGEGDARDRLRGIQLTIEKAVPDIRPAELAMKGDTESVTLEDTGLLRHRQGRAINQGDISETDGTGSLDRRLA